MTWFKVDDSFYSHPKVLALRASRNGKGAIALWTLAGSWSSQQLTEGRVPQHVVAMLGASRADAEALVAAGLWARDESASGPGYVFHDWLARNPSRDSVEKKREKTKERVEKWRARNAVTSDDCNAVTDPFCNASANAAPDPTRPDPSRSTAYAVDARERAASSSDEPESEYGRRLRTLTLAWRRRYERAMGMAAAGNHDAEMRQALEVLESATGGEPEAMTALLGAVLDGYFGDEYLRRNPKTASARNFVQRLNTLILAAKQTHTLDRDPPDYDPARHGPPKESRNDAKWNRYLDEVA